MKPPDGLKLIGNGDNSNWRTFKQKFVLYRLLDWKSERDDNRCGVAKYLRDSSYRGDTELQVQVKDSSDDNEIKALKDEVHMEEETLQTVKALCRNTQETTEKLEERKTQLKEELKMIYDLQKQEREVLQSLQEEQQELEQTVQQYDSELCAAAEDLLQLQREVAYAKAHTESLHAQITPLQDVFEEIVQVKKKLAELVAGLITGESAMTEMTEDAHCAVLDQELVGKVDVVESECDHVYREKIMSTQEAEEVDYVEQESTAEELDKMQYSVENLKSSGSSSFTEITLTEVKEEDVMFRSTTPQGLHQVALCKRRRRHFLKPHSRHCIEDAAAVS
ncbi:Epidermal growth factor receptor substrate 15 [Anabarilius grahami]|uniref:Epidermal growth factor receptor substrate 15 n=1 Tax=Anabarilius grahami TaxID=495550 RepID=A0A3N0YI32_ANAGA|nr:Epidermal growth factor receptor substrate 15 [Anabarilius grahami]